MNAATDCSASAPTPIATAITCTYSPSAFPTTVSTATRGPPASARATTNSTLGPGIAITTNAVRTNASNRSAGTTATPAYAALPRRSASNSSTRRLRTSHSLGICR